MRLHRSPIVSREALNRAALLFAICLSALVAIRFDGVLPADNLDAGWQFGLAEALDMHLAFGQNVVITFGPLSFVYSGFYLPSQRSLYLLFSLYIYVIFVITFFEIISQKYRLGIIILPIVLANTFLLDGLFIFMPILTLMIVSDNNLLSKNRKSILVLYVSVLGLLPLIKGTMIAPVMVSTILSIIILLKQNKKYLAFLLFFIPFCTLIACWVALGQPINALRLYFLRQGYVAGGYTDAMSLYGENQQIFIYLLVSVTSVILFAWKRGTFDLAMAIFLSFTFFVAFKAAFVRHDGHALIAGSVLLLIGVIVPLRRPEPPTIMAGLICVAGWAFIDSAFISTYPIACLSRFTSSVARSGKELARIIRHPADFEKRFAAANQAIANRIQLTSVRGPADIYTVRQVELLASGQPYSPRPVIQSYAAYTPELEELDKNHLLGADAPKTIFFALEGNGDRYPSLADGASWPELLARYSFRQFSNSLAVLDQSATPDNPQIEAPTFDRLVGFDRDVIVSDVGPLVWAHFEFRPNLIGRLVSFIWKRPFLWIDVTYRDHHTKRFRIIAGMSAAGFLLSPTVDDAPEFVALRTDGSGATAATEVKSFSIHQEGTLWGHNVHVKLSTLHLSPDTGAMGAPAVHDVPLTTMAKGGDCSIDMIGPNVVASRVTPMTGRFVNLTGWGYAQATGGIASEGLRIAVADAGGNTRYFPTERSARADLDAHFGATTPGKAGFATALDLDGLQAPYEITVIQDINGKPNICPIGGVYIVRPNSRG